MNFLQKNLKHQKVRFGRDINNTLVQSISQSTFKERQRRTYVHKLLSERVRCSSEDTACDSPLTGIKNICQQIKDLENPPPVNPLEFNLSVSHVKLNIEPSLLPFILIPYTLCSVDDMPGDVTEVSPNPLLAEEETQP